MRQRRPRDDGPVVNIPGIGTRHTATASRDPEARLLFGGPAVPWFGASPSGILADGSAGGSLEGLGTIAMAAFAAVGFSRGARREWISLGAAVASYLAIDRHWPTLAAWMNRALDAIPGLGRAGNPATEALVASPPAPTCEAVVPLGEGAAIWQIAVFVLAVLAAYFGSQRIGSSNLAGLATLVRLPDLVDRLVGATLGAATGYVTATFLLDRLLPAVDLQLTGSQSLASDSLARLGPPGMFAIVALLILFGVVGLESRGKRTFG